MEEKETKNAFHLISFETQFGKIPLYTSDRYEPGAKASVIIGPNGSGKSQVLAAICNELINIHRIRHLRTKSEDEPELSRRVRMLDFEEEFPALTAGGQEGAERFTGFEARIVYRLDQVVWDIRRESRTLKILRDGIASDIEALDFPDRVLAIAHLPLDKFKFSKRREGDFYRYLGLRQSNNMTSTGALSTKTLLSFLETLNLPIGKAIRERWFPLLGLDGKIYLSVVVASKKLLNAIDKDQFRELGLENLQRQVGRGRAQSFYEYGSVGEQFDQLWQVFCALRDRSLKAKHSGARTAKFLCELNMHERGLTETFNDLADILRLGQKLRIMGQFSLCFSKGEQLVPFDDLSSGEQHILSTVTQLIANLGDRSVVLIDEPEVSLHPDWQRQYLPNLLRCLSSNPDTHAIIATHSHFLVSDIQETKGSLTIAKHDGGGFESFDREVYGRSADNILYRVFGIGSAGNRFVELDLAMALKMISGTASLDIVQLQNIRHRLAGLTKGDNAALSEILNSIDTFLERGDLA